jgi:hypothetical protein
MFFFSIQVFFYPKSLEIDEIVLKLKLNFSFTLSLAFIIEFDDLLKVCDQKGL